VQFIELARKRYGVRSYKAEPVEDDRLTVGASSRPFGADGGQPASLPANRDPHQR
jgi:hypothetical protein